MKLIKAIKNSPFTIGTGTGAVLCYFTKFFAGFFFGGLGTVYIFIGSIWK